MTIKEVLYKVIEKREAMSNEDVSKGLIDTYKKDSTLPYNNILEYFLKGLSTWEMRSILTNGYLKEGSFKDAVNAIYKEDKNSARLANEINNDDPFAFYNQGKDSAPDIAGIQNKVFNISQLKGAEKTSEGDIIIQLRSGRGKKRENLNDTETALILINEKIGNLLEKGIYLDSTADRKNTPVKKILASLMVFGGFCDSSEREKYAEIIDYYSPIICEAITKSDTKESSYGIIKEAQEIAQSYCEIVDPGRAFINKNFIDNILHDVKLVEMVNTKATKVSQTDSVIFDRYNGLVFIDKNGKKARLFDKNKEALEKIYAIDKELFGDGIKDKPAEVSAIMLTNAIIIANDNTLAEEDKENLFQAHMIPFVQLCPEKKEDKENLFQEVFSIIVAGAEANKFNIDQETLDLMKKVLNKGKVNFDLLKETKAAYIKAAVAALKHYNSGEAYTIAEIGQVAKMLHSASQGRTVELAKESGSEVYKIINDVLSGQLKNLPYKDNQVVDREELKEAKKDLGLSARGISKTVNGAFKTVDSKTR